MNEWVSEWTLYMNTCVKRSFDYNNYRQSRANGLVSCTQRSDVWNLLYKQFQWWFSRRLHRNAPNWLFFFFLHFYLFIYINVCSARAETCYVVVCTVKDMCSDCVSLSEAKKEKKQQRKLAFCFYWLLLSLLLLLQKQEHTHKLDTFCLFHSHTNSRGTSLYGLVWIEKKKKKKSIRRSEKVK